MGMPSRNSPMAIMQASLSFGIYFVMVGEPTSLSRSKSVPTNFLTNATPGDFLLPDS